MYNKGTSELLRGEIAVTKSLNKCVKSIPGDTFDLPSPQGDQLLQNIIDSLVPAVNGHIIVNPAEYWANYWGKNN